MWCIIETVIYIYINMCVNIAYMVHKLRIEMLPLAKYVRERGSAITAPISLVQLALGSKHLQ